MATDFIEYLYIQHEVKEISINLNKKSIFAMNRVIFLLLYTNQYSGV